MSLAEERIGPGVERAWKVVVGQEVSGNSAVDQKRQHAGALQTLCDLEGAVGSRGSAWTAAACRRRVGATVVGLPTQRPGGESLPWPAPPTPPHGSATQEDSRSGKALSWAVHAVSGGVVQNFRRFGASGSGSVGLRARCCSSKAPASGRTANASRSRRRRGEPRQRMDCGGLPPLWEAGGGEAGPSTGCYQHGLRQGRSGREREKRRCARGNSDPAGCSICGSTSSAGMIGVRNGGRMGRAPAWWMRAAGRIGVRFSGPASLGLRPGRKL